MSDPATRAVSALKLMMGTPVSVAEVAPLPQEPIALT
jgi:hypothetical protein